MAKKTGDNKAGSSLGITIFLILTLFVLLTAGSAYVATLMFGDEPAREQAVEDLRRSFSAHNLLQQQRFRHLEQACEVLLTQERVTGQLVGLLRSEAADRDLDSAHSRFEESQHRLDYDLTLLLDQDQRPVLRSDQDEATGAPSEDLASVPLLAKAAEDKLASGILVLDDALYQATVALLARDFELVGYLVLALRFDQDLAVEIRRASGNEAAFLRQTATGPVIVAATLDPALQPDLVPALRRDGQTLKRLRGGQTVDRADLVLAERPWIAFLAPLRDPAEEPVGAMVTLVSPEDRLAGFVRTRWVLLGVAGAAIVLGLIASLLVGGRTLRPLTLLTTAVREAAEGRLERPMPIAKAGSLRPLAVAADQLVGRFRDRQQLGSFVAQLSRHLPEPARTEAAEKPRSAELAIVTVEMRRFANPKIGYDPGEHLGRYAHDLQRISTVVAARQGTVAAILGHRLMSTFEGEDRAVRALAAATEILLLLSIRENAFDEPVPPVVALTRSSVALATLAWSGRSATAVAGLGVQQLESLLREATPGELYLSREIHGELAEHCRQAGIEIRSQRGLMSPIPLFVLDAKTAMHLTGVEPPKPKTSLLTEDRRSLDEVTPGIELAHRYEILAELGGGPNGVVFKARANHGAEVLRLKILRPRWSVPGNLDRLRNTLRQARGVDHPGVLSHGDLGDGEGLRWVASPFLSGLSLRQALQLSPQVPLAVAYLIGRQVGLALAAVHRHGMVHGAVKPDNILLEADGTVRLLDLGFALPVDADGEGQTQGGAAYLSPELLAGGEAVPRSDVYGLGVLLFEMITGQVPYPGSDPREVRERHRQPPPSPSASSQIPPRFEQALLRCLEPAPERRFASVDEVLAALESLRR